MSAARKFKHLLVLPHLHVQNANAISSPLTHGFPSITAFLGLMWALERKTRAAGLDLSFEAVGVVCHDHQEQVTEGGFVKTFRLTRNPGSLREHKKMIDKDGQMEVAAIVEEGRIHVELSLVFAIDSARWRREPDARDADIPRIAELLPTMRVAGGTVFPPAQPWRRRYQPFVIDLTGTEEDQRIEFRKQRMRLLPGFALVARDDLLDSRLTELQKENANATRLEAWLSLSRINWRYHPAKKENAKGEWVHDRSGLGWVVPMPVGYGALGPLHEAGTVANARDATTPFRFVESLYSIGEWVSPHRLREPRQLLWYAESNVEKGLYRCRNHYRTTDLLFDLSEVD